MTDSGDEPKFENQARQGDVLLDRVPDAEVEGTEVPSGVVREGEQTGHHHRIRKRQLQVLEERPALVDPKDEPKVIRKKNGDLVVKIGKIGAVLDHQEHGKIRLKPGTYRVVPQREWDPLSEQARRTRD
jgi:mRNA-degrading endonuclease RelE of RelBE toxin-antitoxin system